LTARIVALTKFPTKGSHGQTLQEANLLAGLGMEGNFYQGGERQLCLFTEEIREWMDMQAEQGICFRRFKENLLLAGIPGGILPPDAHLQAGDAVLQISKDLKSCHDECKLSSRGARCQLSGIAVFATVERSGLVRIGDCVCVQE